MAVLMVLIVSAFIIALELTGSGENIVLECYRDGDCYKTCSGCVSRSSSIPEGYCPLSYSLCKCVKNSCQYLLSEDQAKDIVDEKFPGSDKDAELTDCDGTPCWEINFTLGNISGVGGGGGSAEVVVNAETGEIIEEYCGGDECKECDYFFSEITQWGEIRFYNIGCENPKPTCDLSNLCRPCESEYECLSRNISSTTWLDIGQTVILERSYYLIGTNTTAKYNDTSTNCTIYANETSVYSELINLAGCEEEILSRVICDGECKPL